MPRSAVTIVLCTALIAVAGSTTSAALPPVSSAVDGLPVVTRPTTVTLVTGDKVRLSPGDNGTQLAAEPATRADGSRGYVRVTETRGRTLAVPRDATPYLAAGVLDPTLFDVGYLVANGYTDGETDKLPLITQLAGSVPAAKVRNTADAVPGVAPTAELGSLHATAAEVPKDQAGSFWAAISQGTRITAARSLQRGVSKVWLDRKVHAVLDQSVPMIGAPQAWAAGYDGSGVKLAVLDTGIDQNHPDLKGRVTLSKNFTPDSDLADGYGHGTHVASILTGSGAASGGKYKGVAPGIQLMVGKVLDHTGNGLESDVIAGMEWAAAAGAKVISLSLGGQAPVDEAQDPGALAIERLTAQTGALFVVAAGNEGKDSSISSPGVAAAALTVASVDKQDHLASYSSRGPLPYADRVDKPDIAGPGSDIVAARAAGTSMGSPLDDYYTAASGTSMATPHVAGAAAILVQEHPDWSATQLKAALMSTSKDDGYNAFQQGAGRVDLARAISQQVAATNPAVDFGRLLDSDQAAVTRQVGYRNDSAGPVTLRLETSLRATTGADLGPAVSAPTQLVVPAHRTATADVALDPAKAGSGLATGVVLATADGLQVRTPIALRRSGRTFPVQVTVRSGAPIQLGATLHALNVDDSTISEVPGMELSVAPDRLSATVRLELAPGHWSINVAHDRLLPNQRLQEFYLTEPEVDVSGPIEVVLDDAKAVPFGMTVDRPTQPLSGGMVLDRTTSDGGNWLIENVPAGEYTDQDLFVTPTAPVTRGSLVTRFDSNRGTPRIRVTVDSKNGRGETMTPNYRRYPTGGLHRFEGVRTKLGMVDVGWSVEPAELQRVRGKLVLMSFTWMHGGYSCELDPAELQALAKAGAVGVLQEMGDCAGYPGFTPLDDLPVAGIDASEGVRLRELLAAGPVTVTLAGTPATPTAYHLAVVRTGSIPADLNFRIPQSRLARVTSSFTPDQGPRNPLDGQLWVGARLTPQERHLFSWVTYVEMPQTRQDVYGPIESGQQWIRQVSSDYSLISMEDRRTILRPGRMPDERWLDAPRGIGPADVPASATNATVIGWCFACRDEDRLTLVPSYAGADRLRSTLLGIQGASVRLYRDGQEVPAGPPVDGQPSYRLAPGRAQYRLTVDSDLATGPQARLNWYTHSARQHSEWTFQSGHVSSGDMGGTTCIANYVAKTDNPCAPQKLLYLRYNLPTDQNNQIPRGVVPLRITPYYERSAHPTAAAFKAVTVRVSYDDGKTWSWVPGANLRTAYQGLLVLPRTAKSVALRVEATDLSGNAISQTLHDVVGIQ